jgi:alanine racemase
MEHPALSRFRAMGIRPGLGVYGICPLKGVQQQELKPALSLHSKVMMVKQVQKGQGVSYSHTWKAPHATRVGVIPVGYGDGFPRLLSNVGRVFVKGRGCPIVGHVCMDYLMVDLGALPTDVALGADVLLLGRSDQYSGCEIGVPQVAEQAKTISWEILTRLTGRLPRVYTQ